MGKLQTAVTLPKRILLQGWANDEGGVNINGEYTYTINFDISIIQGGPSTLYNGYKHNTLNAFIYYFGEWDFVTTANSNQWDNPSSNPNILPLNGWIENNAQGPAGSITILENISGKNTKISVKRNNLGGGTLLLNYIFDPKEIQGLSLWLKADAGVTTTTVGGVNSTTGKVGNCASFDGQNGGGSYNSRLYTDSFGVTVSSDFSLSVWIKPRNFNNFQHIIGAPFQNGFFIGADGTDLIFNLYNGTLFGITAPTVSSNTWHHYVFIRDGNTLKLYADNSLIGTADVTGESFTGNPVFSVGGGEFNEYYFNGDIDEMALYSRAITVPEISTLYNSGNGTNYAGSPTSMMVSYWSLNESSGIRYDSHGSNNLSESPASIANVTEWADQSGNGKNATAIESPTYVTNSINGKPALVFANNAYLTTSNIFNGANPRTMFAVYYIDSAQYSNTVIGQSNEDNTDIGTYFLLQSRIDLDSSPYLAGYSDDLSGPSFVNQQLLLGMADYDGTTARLFKNGTLVNSASKTYDTYNGEFYIGAFSEAGTIQEKFGGKIAEIVLYNRVLTTPERQQVEAYLKAKYAITCGYQNTNKLAETSGNNAPIGFTFNHIAFDYASFAGYCSALGLNPATILNDLGGVDFSSNYVVIRAKTSSTINADSISDLGGGVINITNVGNASLVASNYYRFFVMCKEGWNTVNFYGVNYPI